MTHKHHKDPTDTSSYRPIVLLGKTFERILADRFTTDPITGVYLFVLSK